MNSYQYTALWALTHYAALIWTWYFVLAVSAWHCLVDEKGVDRLTWIVVIIFLPIIGFIFYWWYFFTKTPGRPEDPL